MQPPEGRSNATNALFKRVGGGGDPFNYPFHAADSAGANQCPAGWAAAGQRCFRVTKQVGTHEACAMELCPALQGGTQQPTATLASIGSLEENRLLFESLLLGRDLWIGLYRSAPASQDRLRLEDGWQWANKWVNQPPTGASSGNLASGVTGVTASGASSSAPAFTNWHTGEPDAGYGREDCAYISGATGRWGDYGCELAEMRCLCESGGVPTTANYINFSSEHAEDSKREARRQRLWAALVVVVLTCITLPLTSAMADTTASRGQQSRQRLAVHAGLALIVGGFAPFVVHAFFGRWTAMQLGTWANYAPFGALGGFIVLDATPNTSHQQRLLAVIMGSLFLTIGSACLVAAAYFGGSDRSIECGLFCGFALVNCIAAYQLCRLGLRQSTPHIQLNARINFLSRLVTGTSALLILFHCSWIGVQDPDEAFQHPYTPSIAATGFTWLALAIFGEQDTVSKRWQYYKKASESEPCATAAGTEVRVQNEREGSNAQKRPKSACAAACVDASGDTV